jgi:hypothetical protein
MKKALSILALVTLFIGSAIATPTGDAISVLNAFIATFAKDNPAWKTDVVAIADPANCPPGRQLGYSSVLGYYSFLPKTWDQLSDGERQGVYNDSRLKAFIVSLRNANNYPTMTNTDAPKPAFGAYPIEGLPQVQTGYYYQNGGTPYYSPNQLSPATALVQPVTVVQPSQPQMSHLRVSPEEMLTDRPIKIYMQNQE